MRNIVRLLTLLAVLAFTGASAQAQVRTSYGCYIQTAISATGRSLFYEAANREVTHFSGEYYTTGTPTGVSITIETGNVLAGTSAPFGKLSALTNTTSAQYEEVAGGARYWYVNVGTLSGGSSPTVVFSFCMRPIVALNNQLSASIGAGTLVFEGATVDDFENTITVTDPTADRTTTLPDAGGTVMLSSLATNGAEAANAVTGASNALVFEGATADAFELSLAPTDVGADVTATLPGNANASYAVMHSALTTNDTDAANAVWGVSNGIRFEGVTANAFETTLSPTDVGADVTVTIPGGGNAAFALVPNALTTNDVEVVNSIWGVSNGLRFEGATADAFETTISPVDPTADQTVSIPNFAVAWAILGSTLTTNNVDAANSIWATSNSLVFEGLTADGNETTFTPADPTADQTITIPSFAVNWALMGSTLTTNAIDAANSIWGTSGNLAFEGATADTFETFITATDPAIDTTVTIPAIASGATTLGQIEVSFIDDPGTPIVTDRVFFIATKGYIVSACSQIHSVAAGGASTLQVTKETTTGAPGTGTDLLTAAFDLNATANTVQAKTSGDFVSLAARTMATGDRLSVDYANAIQSTAGNVVTCSLIPN